jgi:putative holliday junction resolvase
MSEYLGLDYGLRRIGIAASDDNDVFALALGTHVEGRDGSIFVYLDKIIRERGCRVVVMGLPLTADGREMEMAQKARKFAGMLEEKTGLPVVLWDERYSSREADHWLATKKKQKKEDRDAMAAEIILQSYLDYLSNSGGK